MYDYGLRNSSHLRLLSCLVLFCFDLFKQTYPQNKKKSEDYLLASPKHAYLDFSLALHAGSPDSHYSKVGSPSLEEQLLLHFSMKAYISSPF